MKKAILAITCLLSVPAIIWTQNESNRYFQGYAEAIRGKHFTYHSPIPKATQSLLLRGRADFEALEWNTEAVPEYFAGSHASFIFAFGMDVTGEPVRFHLSMNERRWFSFENSKTSTTGIKTILGEQGAELLLNVTMLDKYSDQMGFAVLTLPMTSLRRGAHNTIRVEAEPAGNNAWFMVFKTPVEEGVDIYQNHVVVKSGANLLHSVSVDFIHVGEETEASIRIGEVRQAVKLKAGFNKMDVNLPKVDSTTAFTAYVSVGKQQPKEIKFTLSPVREWEIFLVQHTHTDIGYTRPQTEILPEHLRYIDHALDYCDQTDNYPDAAKFRWTCETSWSVREYLRSRPREQVDRLLRRLKEGRIEATGMFFNYSEIIDETALATQTKVLRMLKNQGIDVTTAMQNDVNGIGWCLVDYFQNTGVKYLTMGIHAHRAQKPFNQPTAFWWQSPAGNRLLAYRSEHYQHGNALSLTTGEQDVFRNNLSEYLKSLEERGYPYKKAALQFSGYVTDNSPPSTKACDIIRVWNEKYKYPKLRSALARDFLIFLDEYHAGDIEAKEVAWPDWWTDGVASAANETKVARQTHVEIASTTALLSMAKILGAVLPEKTQQEVEEVYDNLLFYDEHTHGAAESISDPLAQNTINQWGMKSSFAWEAARRSSALQEKALAFLEPHLPKSGSSASIAVFNTLGWRRSGMVRLFIPYAVIPEGADFTITCGEGKSVPAQVFERRQEGAYFGLWVENIPPMGFKTLRISLDKKKPAPLPAGNAGVFENDFYKITIDSARGGIAQIFDKQLRKALLDADSTYCLGQFIYEELANRHELERLTEQNRDTVYRPLHLSRTTLSNIRITGVENGSIYRSFFLHGDMPVCADERGVDIEIRLYHFEKKIELLYRMFKLPVHSPEAVYVAFPFRLDGGRLAFEVQGGIVRPGIDQLEGSASDWNTIQNFAQVKSRDAQVVFTSDEIPLVQFGAINTGRYYYRLQPKTNHLYSWVLNNYWVTNFKASQSGELLWSYALTSSDDTSNAFAACFGRNNRTPFPSRILFSRMGSAESTPVSRSLLDLGATNLLLADARPTLDGKGIVLQIRELEGGHARLDLKALLRQTGASSAEEVNILEESIGALNGSLRVEHFETKFIRLDF
jgi:hypothetical protein